MEAFTGRVRDRVLSDARWKKLQVQSHKSVCSINTTPLLCYVLEFENFLLKAVLLQNKD